MHSMARVFITCVLFASLCHAEIYRCTAPDGSAVFADTPCGADAKRQVVKPIPPSEPQIPSPPSPPAANHMPPQMQATLEGVARRCAAEGFNAWIRTQAGARPDLDIQRAKLAQVTAKCRTALRLPEASAAPAPASTPARPAASSRSPTVLTARSGSGQPLVIERGSNLQPATCTNLAITANGRGPPVLYLGVADCVKHDEYQRAIELFVLAGLDSQFDAERVRDKSGQQTGQDILMNALQSIAPKQREAFARAIQALHASPQSLAALCEKTHRIGYPTYFPDYMVMHSANSLTVTPQLDALKPAFDAAATWQLVRTRYLNCN
jgi:hypothetical protein